MIFLSLLAGLNQQAQAGLTEKPSKEQCAQSLIQLLETDSDAGKIRQMFATCANHGTPEQQLKSAKDLAHALNKPDIEEKVNQTLYEITLAQQNKAEAIKKNDGWRWYHWLAGIWALFGCCVATEKAIDDYYESQPLEAFEEKGKKKKKAQNVKPKENF